MGIRGRLAVHVVGGVLGGSIAASCALVSGVDDLKPTRDVDASFGASRGGTGGTHPDSGASGSGGANPASSGGRAETSTGGAGGIDTGGSAGAPGSGADAGASGGSPDAGELPPDHLVFRVQPPGTVAARVPMTPAIEVAVADVMGRVVASSTPNVTLTLVPASPSAVVINGTAITAANAGVARFANVWVPSSGTGYKIRASTPNLDSILSDAFDGVAWGPIGPYEATLTLLAADSGENLYATESTATGPVGLLRSSDGGLHWSHPSTKVPGDTRLLEANPVRAGVAYYGASGTLYRTTDAGITWAVSDAGLDGSNPYSLAFDPTGDTVYVTTSTGATATGVYRSTDAGAHWAVTTFPVGVIAVDPTDPTRLYSAGPVFSRSTNGGSTWKTISGGPKSVVSLVVNPKDTTIVYAGAFPGGVYRSTNGGDNWSLVTNGYGPSGGPLVSRKILIDPTASATLYSWSIPIDGIYQTKDGGDSWMKILDSAGAQVLGTPLAIHPKTGTAYTAYQRALGRLASDGTWKRLADGMNPTQIKTLLTVPGTLYAGGPDGVWRRTDVEKSWTATRGTDGTVTNIVTQALSPQNMLVESTSPVGPLFRSTDSGVSWVHAKASATSVVISGGTSQAEVLGTNASSAILRSLDLGETFVAACTSACPVAASGPFVLRRGGSDPSIVYASRADSATTLSTLFRSADSGATWAQTSPSELSLLAIDPMVPATLYATDKALILKSTDSGSHWTQLASGHNVTALVVDPGDSQRVFFVSPADGFFQSEDGGAYWAPVMSGLPALSITSLAVDSSGNVYAGTDGGGTYELPKGVR